MSLTFSSHSLIKLAISLFFGDIFFTQYTSANVTITGQDETIYVTEDDIYIPASATNYQFYKYVDAGKGANLRKFLITQKNVTEFLR